MDSLLSTAEDLQYCTSPLLVIQSVTLYLPQPLLTLDNVKKKTVDVGQLHPFKTNNEGTNQERLGGRLLTAGAK